MVLTRDMVLFYDIEMLIEQIWKTKSFFEDKTEQNEMLRVLKKTKFKPADEAEIELIDMRLVDSHLKRTFNSFIETLNIKKESKIGIRDLSGYSVYDPHLFRGVELDDIKEWFGEENILYMKKRVAKNGEVKPMRRKAQALIRYNDKIRSCLEKGYHFYHLATTEEGEGYQLCSDDAAMFDDFFHIENSNTKERHYFGAWR